MSNITSAVLLLDCLPDRLLQRLCLRDPSHALELDRSFNDIGLDSLDKIELLFAVEERFGLSIPDDVAVRLTSVKEVIAYLSQAVKQS